MDIVSKKERISKQGKDTGVEMPTYHKQQSKGLKKSVTYIDQKTFKFLDTPVVKEISPGKHLPALQPLFQRKGTIKSILKDQPQSENQSVFSGPSLIPKEILDKVDSTAAGDFEPILKP